MRHFAPAASAAAVFLAAVSSVSAQIVYDGFDYGSSAIGRVVSGPGGSGALLHNPINGDDWRQYGGVGVKPTAVLTGTSLAYPGLPASPGGAYGVTGGSTIAGASLATGLVTPVTPDETLYYSFTLRINDLTGVGGPGSLFAGFSSSNAFPGSSTYQGANVAFQQDPVDPTRFQVGIAPAAKATATPAITWDTAHSYSAGQTLFVVAAVTAKGAAGGSDDVYSLWVNPDVASFGAAVAAAPTLTATGADLPAGAPLDFAQYHAFGSSINHIQAFDLDDLRVDRAWSQVAPAAGSTWAGGSGNWSPSLPSGAGSFVYLSPGGGTISTGGGQTVGSLTIRGSTPYTLAGGTLTLDAGGPNGTAAVNVQPTMNFLVAISNAIAATHTISAPVALNSPTEFVVGARQTLSVTGGVTGSGSLAKYGAGTLVLSGASNTYTGGTFVDNGTLLIPGSLQGPVAVTNNGTLLLTGSIQGTVAVTGGGILDGSGSVGGLATISSGGILAPGNPPGNPGALTFTGGLTLATGAILDLQIGSPGSDEIVVAGGTLTGPAGTGAVTLKITPGSGWVAGGTYTLIDFSTGGTATSDFDATDFTLPTVAPGYNLQVVDDKLQVTVYAFTPEPSTGVVATGAVALAGIAGRRRHRRPAGFSASE